MKKVNQLYIIIAEDDHDDGELMCEYFEKNESFKNLKWVKNGKELLDNLHSDQIKPDLILTDINMPIMNGIEAVEEIFNNPALCGIPVFVFSSANNPIYEAKCKQLGCIAFLLKPFDLSGYEELPYKLIYLLKTKFATELDK